MHTWRQLSLAGILAMPVFIAAGIWSVLLIRRLDSPEWWRFLLLTTCAGACFGAAIGAPVGQLRDFATVGGGLVLFLSLFMLLLETFVF